MQQPVEVQVDEHEQIVERVAAIDVAKASGMVCLRVPHASIPGRRVTKVWPVRASTAALVELGDHLRCERVQRVVMESTSDYWRSFYYLLEAAGLTVWLVNAAQAKNVPGRPKTDKIDAVWLAKLAERSMVAPSLVPAEPMRRVRDLARARFDLVVDRVRVKQRIEKLLEDALIKISSVLTDALGVSGRAMIEALIAGQRNPAALAELAKGRARTRRADLEQALHGRFTDHHAQLARMLLGQLDELTARITQVTDLLDAAIRALPAPTTTTTTTATTHPSSRTDGDQSVQTPAQAGYNSAVARLCAVPGAGPDSVRAVLGESGRRGALLRRAPLRTVHATRRRTRLKQAARALRVLLLRRLEDPPPQPPDVALMDPPVMASQSGTSSGPFTVAVSNLPFGGGGLISVSVQRLTCPRQRPFGPSHEGWYPASYPGSRRRCQP
jgi:transposase